MFNLDPRVRHEVAAHPYPLLFVTISGAHLYGFASPDSDYDLRGAHLLPLRELVGLRLPRETVEISEVRDGLEMDVVTHDARKFFGLLLKNSGYALEQVLSPLVVVTSPSHEELCAIARRSVGKLHARHYFGFAENQWKLFARKMPHRVKPLLYIYRVLFTGIHLMNTGQIECDLGVLNEEFRSPQVAALMAIKKSQQENTPLPEADLAFYEQEYQRLQLLLREAEARSSLPERAEVWDDLNDLLLRLRLGGEDGAQNKA